MEKYGHEVRECRLDSGFTLVALAARVQSNKSQLSRVELGQTSPSSALREALDSVVGGGRLGRLWAEVMGDGRPEWLGEIAAAMRAAHAVYDYQALTFPSYLQTEGYAFALIRSALPGMSKEELDVRLAERLKRVEQMRMSDRPMIWVVVDSSVLRRRYGGVSATAEQIDYVIQLGESGRITLQVVPEDLPEHPGNSGGFRVLTMPDGRDLAYVESPEYGQILTSVGTVCRRRALFASLQAAAAAPGQSLALLRDELDRIRT